MHLEEPPKLVQPRNHKAKVLIWADLTVSDMDLIDDAVTPEILKMELARIFQMEDFTENLKNGILVDLFYYTIQFCRDNNFSKEQTSAFFSIVKQTHQVCVETPFGNVEQTFNYFKELVLCHAVKRPPFSIDLFTPLEVKQITEYVINTYFRHFKMYKYVFTPLVRLDLSMQYIGMPPTPEPEEVEESAREGEEEEGEKAEGEGGEGGEKKEGEGDQPSEQGEVKDGETAESQQGEEKDAKAESSKPSSHPAQPPPSRNGKRGKHRVRFEESPAAKELRKLIKQHLSEEISKLKTDVEQQIKESEETINQRLAAVEPKGGRNSGKGKKK